MKTHTFFKYGLSLLSIPLLLLTGIQVLGATTPLVGNGQTKVVSVLDTGAKGDGVTDDTAAFQQAIDEAKQKGQSVLVPGGRYWISDTLSVDGVNILGDDSGAWPADSDSLPTLYMANGSRPLFSLKNCSVAGLKIVAQTTSSTRNNFRECLRIDGSKVTIRHMKLDRVTTGIRTAASGITGLVIENVFMPTTHQEGVSVSDTKGTVLKNIEMWTPTQNESDFPVNGMGLYLANNQDLYMQGCFVFNAARGIVFEGKNNAVLDNCSVDLTSRGVEVRGSGKITVNGGTFWTHASGVYVKANSTAELTVSGAELRSNGDATVNVLGGQSVCVEGCIIRRTMDNRNVPAISLGSTGNVSIRSCMIYCELKKGEGPAAKWNADIRNLTFMGNILSTEGNTYSKSVSQSNTVKNNIVTPSSGSVQ